MEGVDEENKIITYKIIEEDLPKEYEFLELLFKLFL